MNIIKEWYGKTGLLARFYSCNGIYFLDYDLCRETTKLLIHKIGGKVVVTPEIPDTPKKYLTEIASLVKKGVC